MHRTRWMLVVGLLVAALTVAACRSGNDNSSSSDSNATATETATPTETATADSGGTSASGGGEKLALAAPADGSLKFDKTELKAKAKAGKVTINFDNPSSVPHAVQVEGNGIEEKGTDTITKSKASVTLDLKPGSYEFYCPVGNHRSAGMEGKITVS